MKTNGNTSRGAGSAKSEAVQNMRRGVFRPSVYPVSYIPIPVLSVVKGLPSAVEYRAITCSCPVETPAISTDL
jgi:hypothetical protein